MEETLMKKPTTIYGTNIDQPPSETIEEIRDNISDLRGQIQDIIRAYPLWRGHLDCSEGGLTCVLIALHGAKEEMEKHKAKWGHKPDWVEDAN